MSDRYVLWFDDHEDGHHARVGGKGASLGVLTRAGLPVPPGFTVTVEAYERLKEDAVAVAEIRGLLGEVDVGDVAALAELSAKVRARIEAIPMADDVAAAVAGAYERLCERCDDEVPVAVRSSATAEDLPDASFAGQQDTFLWVRGVEGLLHHLRRCWSSLFTDRAISYRHETGHDHERISMAVCVQKMVRPKAAGVAFTLNPTDGDRSVVAIDSSWGFGEAVVAGEVTPDNFLVDKVLYEIVSRTISPKTLEYRIGPDGEGVEPVEVPPERVEAPSLSDEEVKAVARLARQAERHYGSPQDLEWAVDADLPGGENVVLLQSRPETVWSRRPRRTVAKPGQGLLDGIVSTLLSPVHTRGKAPTVEDA